MTLSRLAFWSKGQKVAKVNGGGGAKQFFSKLSGAFMLPISVMSIAGLFLGIGAAIASHSTGGAATFGKFIQNLGDPVFGAMPVLFAAAIVVAFTDEAGVGVFASIIGMLIFSAIQAVFITDISVPDPTPTDPNHTLHKGYEVLFGGGGRTPVQLDRLVGSTMGIQSLNTSVFGGIVVGSIVASLYNRFYRIALPVMLSFFGGKRFVSLVTIVAMIPTAFIFLLFWPYIGFVLSKFGEATGHIPYGFESFIFGFVERSLIPFGLHHVFYAPLWYSSAGGDALAQLDIWNAAGNTLTGLAGDTTTGGVGLRAQILSDKSKWVGDSFTWIAASGLKYDSITWTDSAGAAHSAKVFPFFADELHIKLGRYMQGKFPFMIFALPAAGAAMVMAAPKENRKLALGTVFPAALTALVTGVTEPIEFTFLFLAPWLFWGFHAFMAALSFMLMNLFGAHIGMTFSGGLLDFVIYGLVPLGKGTAFYWVFVIGPVYAPIYYFFFLWAIKRFNLATPGRGENVKLFSKADFQNKNASAVKGEIKPQSAAIVAAYGGWDNITKFTNCASRLRYDVVDGSKVNEGALKAAGVAGVKRVGNNHVQAILGPVAEQVNADIIAHKGANLGNAQVADVDAHKVVSHIAAVNVKSVVAGTVKTLASLKDGVFSEKLLGDGVVVSVPATVKKADYLAPVSGELVTVFPTGHAYGIKTKEGVEVLIHIGLDTVNLQGKGFTTVVKQGQQIEAGDKLVSVDLEFVRKNAPSADTIVIVTSGQTVSAKATGKVTKSAKLFTAK